MELNYGPLSKQAGYPGASNKLRELVMGLSNVQKLKHVLSRGRFLAETPGGCQTGIDSFQGLGKRAGLKCIDQMDDFRTSAKLFSCFQIWVAVQSKQSWNNKVLIHAEPTAFSQRAHLQVPITPHHRAFAHAGLAICGALHARLLAADSPKPILTGPQSETWRAGLSLIPVSTAHCISTYPCS